MSQRQDDTHGELAKGPLDNDLEQQILYGAPFNTPPSIPDAAKTLSPSAADDEEQEEQEEHLDSDVQGALGLFAEATQDMATAGVELGLGRHFACVDFCNQAIEKAAQAVSLLRSGRRTTYDHDLRTLGAQVGAPLEIQEEMARLTPFHPETFYADTPPEEADEVINAEQANSYLQSARMVQRWARSIVLNIT